MLGAFLKDADGGFDIAGLAISLVGLWMVFGTALWFLPRAIRTGRMPYGAGFGGPRIYWLERQKHPVGFWILFALYSLMIPIGIFVATQGLFGWSRKQG
jgi:hypothetical protein